MKRISFYLSLIVVILGMPTCSTIDQEAVKKVDKAAVAIVGVNKQLNYESSFNIGQLVQKLAQDDKFDLAPLADKLRNETFGTYERFFPFELIAEEKVTQADRYQDFRMYDDPKKEQNLKVASSRTFFITPDKYLNYYPQLLNTRDKRSRLFEAVPEAADGILMMNIYYKMIQERSLVPGVKKGKVEAHLRMDLIKENGERIFKIDKKAKSNNKVKVVLNTGILKPEKIKPLCVDATNQVMAEAERFLRKKLAS